MPAAERTHYEILGVAKTATDAEIKKAYRQLSLKLHPDRNMNKPKAERDAAENEYKLVTVAHAILADKQKRAAYDFELAHPAKPQPSAPSFGNSYSNPYSAYGFNGYNDYNDFDDFFSNLFGGKPKPGNFGKASYSGYQAPKYETPKYKAPQYATLKEFFADLGKEPNDKRKGFINSNIENLESLLERSGFRYSKQKFLEAIIFADKVSCLQTFLKALPSGSLITDTIINSARNEREALAQFLKQADYSSASPTYETDLESFWKTIVNKLDPCSQPAELIAKSSFPFNKSSTYKLGEFLSSLIENNPSDNRICRARLKAALSLIDQPLWKENLFSSQAQFFDFQTSWDHQKSEALSLFIFEVLGQDSFLKLFPAGRKTKDPRVKAVFEANLKRLQRPILEALQQQADKIKLALGEIRSKKFHENFSNKPATALSETGKSGQAHEKFKTAFGKVANELSADIMNHKISIPEAERIKTKVVAFADEVLARKLTSASLTAFDKDKDICQLKRRWNWRVLIGLLIGAALGCVAGCVLLGIGAPLTIAVGALVGGTLAGAGAGTSAGFFAMKKTDPVYKLEQTGKRLASDTPSPAP